MINKYRILNVVKYFSLDRLQNYIIFQLNSSYFTVDDSKRDTYDLKIMSRESITNVLIWRQFILMVYITWSLMEYV